MNRLVASALSVAMLACGNGSASTAHSEPAARAKPLGPVADVAPAELCVTHGDLGAATGGLEIDEPTVRAVVPGSHGDAAQLSFTYDGASSKLRALASGEARHQLGLKLRAADGCNLVYVMWRLGPGPAEIVVSVKHNPGEHTNAACGVHGYRTIAPADHAPPPALEPGSTHQLAAAIQGDELIARVDGRVVWRGALHGRADALNGPAGIRTDNVKLRDVKLRTARSSAPARTVAVRCRQVGGLARK